MCNILFLVHGASELFRDSIGVVRSFSPCCDFLRLVHFLVVGVVVSSTTLSVPTL